MKKATIILLIFALAIIFFQTRYVLSDPGLNASNLSAGGGNITPLDINGTAETSVWQGFFGEVSGGIVLSDADGKNMYDWSVVEARGEVLAVRSVVDDWSTVNCTNQTQIYLEEARLNITNSSEQGINDTFTNTTHPEFEVGGRIMSNCRSTLTNNETGSPSIFWNVLLNTDALTTIYAAIIDNNVVGFNGSTVDFQLIVPVNATTGRAIYNIYVELN